MLKRVAPILWLTALCWAVFLVNGLLFHGELTRYGITPRHVAGLPGIISAPFLHGSLAHLMANTLPLLILGTILCLRSRTEFGAVTLAGILVGGGLTWLVGRHASHIGASGLIFCFFGYLASLAIFRRTFGTLCLSIVCVLLYGGMLKGVLPRSSFVSWEGHAAGLLVGITLAWLSAKLNRNPEDQSPTSKAVP